eukprot:sb/3477595/
MCEIRLECSDVNGIIKAFEKWQLKVVPVGEDGNEMVYWYFCETRIYRQDKSVSSDIRVQPGRRTASKKKLRSSAGFQPPPMAGLKKFVYETLLKLNDTPRSDHIVER